jgi:hypothetical protein
MNIRIDANVYCDTKRTTGLQWRETKHLVGQTRIHGEGSK